MQAKLNPDYKFATINACAGIQFDKEIWRNVPADQEADARTNPYLELRERPVDPAPAAAPAEMVNVPAESGPIGPVDTSAEPRLSEGQGDSSEVATTTPEADQVGSVEPTPAAESDAALEAEAEADEQVAEAAEPVAAEDRPAVAKKRSARTPKKGG